ncbi:hypothetical protein [Serinicoccus marinus]|uniref:hypothetical protein n=1 Tax=Serinicoccus marinus TaxID=247333 RepID=UPI00249254B0|nr:hypothetical protein [Serinicoccus marinus]
MGPDFCGDRACAARVYFWLRLPADDGIADPCPACLDALRGVLGLPEDSPRSLLGLHGALDAAGRLP